MRCFFFLLRFVPLAFVIHFFLIQHALASLSVWGFEEGNSPTDHADTTKNAISELLEDIQGGEARPQEPAAPVEIDEEASYDLPIITNKYVEKYITLFQTRLRPNFEKWLTRSGRYIPMMHEILREYQLPEDLVYVALIESGFNPKAHSRARAVGPWQFIKGTGKKYGLRIDRWIDERKDPVKATEAAARYFKDLYGMFDSWPLAMAAYNAGEGRISRAILRVKTRDFWELRSSRILRPETRNYIPKFMAAALIAKNPKKYGFFVDYHDAWQFDEVVLQNAAYLSSIAKHAGISLKEIKKYNPELRRDITPPRAPGYRLKLPPGKEEDFLASYSPEDEEAVFSGQAFKHRVRRGESISSIARKYGVSIDILLETNRLSRKSIIREGQFILVSDDWTAGGDKHRIRRGETISTIASRYKVSMRRLLEVNQLHKRSVIRAGDTLIIPAKPDRRSRPRNHNKQVTAVRKHEIRKGETISTIAKKYAIRMRDLLKANRLTKRSVIRAGHTLIIP